MEGDGEQWEVQPDFCGARLYELELVSLEEK